MFRTRSGYLDNIPGSLQIGTVQGAQGSYGSNRTCQDHSPGFACESHDITNLSMLGAVCFRSFKVLGGDGGSALAVVVTANEVSSDQWYLT